MAASRFVNGNEEELIQSAKLHSFLLKSVMPNLVVFSRLLAIEFPSDAFI